MHSVSRDAPVDVILREDVSSTKIVSSIVTEFIPSTQLALFFGIWVCQKEFSWF